MSGEQAPGLTGGQQRARERSLTQRHAARIRLGINTILVKCDDTFLVSDVGGDICPAEGRGLGLFHRDTRFLSRYVLTLDDRGLSTLSSEHGGGDWATHSLENESLEESSDIKPHTIAVRRYRTAGDAAIRELLVITNYHTAAVRVRLGLAFEADFADIFEVRKISESQPGERLETQLEDAQVQLRCAGRDERTRTITLRFSPAPDRLAPERASFELSLSSGQTREIDVFITLDDGVGEPLHGAWREQPERREHTQRQRPPDPRKLGRGQVSQGRELLAAAAKVHSHPLLEKLVQRSLLDLSLLRCRLAEDLHYIAGGVPWYVTLFGRDSAVCALQVCAFRPSIAGDTVRLLARYQADKLDAYRDAQPGKILHELRRGQLARLNAIPQSPAYYGSVDSTLLFLILVAEYVAWSGDLALPRSLRRELDAALEWIERYGDSDGDGYIDYGGHEHSSGKYQSGLVNEGWKDSGDAIINADGTLVSPPVALCEVQGYLYRAWHSMATLLRLLEDRSGAAELGRKAEALRERFERDFWSEDLGCYLLARQQGARPAAVVASNAGQVLWSGIASKTHAERVIHRMMAADMFSGWGVRTLSAHEIGYNPMSYHRGSVWPHDNSLLCAGFRRYGDEEAALRIFEALYAAASGFRNHRMPELYCGFERSAEESHPVPYPVACSPQAWAAGSIPYALVSLLGLQPDALGAHLRIVRPCLPRWLERLALQGLRIGSSQVDLLFQRAGGGQLEVDSQVRAGTLQVEVVPSA